MISDEWSTPDGTTLEDLQDNLRNTFRLYNQITYNISNMQIAFRGETPLDATFSVSYTVTIISRIYKRNLKHEEKSNVNELVRIDREKGKVQIQSTNSGSYWYVK